MNRNQRVGGDTERVIKVLVEHRSEKKHIDGVCMCVGNRGDVNTSPFAREWHKMAINHSLVNDLKFRPFICYQESEVWVFGWTIRFQTVMILDEDDKQNPLCLIYALLSFILVSFAFHYAIEYAFEVWIYFFFSSLPLSISLLTNNITEIELGAGAATFFYSEAIHFYLIRFVIK